LDPEINKDPITSAEE
jgi:hypothetical protein